jgi:hypothetical protein
MNDIPAPLTAEQVDDLLSAELDGEFAAAATDLGLEVSEAHARLDATPGIAERRAQFAAASAAIADVAELDDVTERRLRAAAVAAADDDVRDLRKRRRRAWIGAVGAAAVVVAVLGIAAVAKHDSTGGSSSSAAGAAKQEPVALSPTTGLDVPFTDLGNLANGAALQKNVRDALIHPASGQDTESLHLSAGVPSAAVGTATTLITNAASSDFYDASGKLSSADAALPPIQRCDATARLAADAKSPPVLYATATLNHQPVTVFVYVHGTEYAIIASDKGCKVVLHRSIDR